MTVIEQKDGTRVPADGQTIGEIVFRGNITMKGYLKDPGATRDSFSGGWFHSGDLAVAQNGHGRDHSLPNAASAINRLVCARLFPATCRRARQAAGLN
jgi:acyl-CoA synthetase (AMP-forming)/AMP-acid ligase II